MNRIWKNIGNLFFIWLVSFVFGCKSKAEIETAVHERILLNEGWFFYKYGTPVESDSLIYDVRPEVKENNDRKDADSKPTEADKVEEKANVLKPWILPSGNEFIKDPSMHYVRPEGNPGADFPFVQANFDDRGWETINLPHDWAIKGPFYVGEPAVVGGGMGRLPSPGVAWYRKKLDIPATYKNKSVFLDVDGAMSYAMVWLNGHLVGGWPYGYNSWRLDLTPYMNPGGENQLAIRLDNPNYSSRWYPGGGIYRHVWLTVTNPVHVAHWGTFVRTEHVSAASATIKLDVKIDNNSAEDASVEVISKIYELDAEGKKSNNAVAGFKAQEANIKAQSSLSLNNEFVLNNPRLWGPPPTQTPDLYLVVTELMQNGQLVDTYETRFGIRDLQYDPNRGLLVNGELVKIHGVNQHHDLGAIGAAFNVRAAQRQLEILRDMGCNAIRMAHNPPAPELLELTDKMGFLVVDEVFDSWERKKTPYDFHLIFPEWQEQDLRSMIRRDKNCPSVVMWSIGNEVGEQYTNEEGAAVAEMLRTIAKDEDPTRLTTASMNYAKPDMPFPAALDIISLNYQGEGIRQDPMFEGTERIRIKPQYEAFHEQFSNKVIVSSETASAFSSRGVYYFPVTSEISDITRDNRGGNSKECQVSSYELHAVDFGSSADKVFASIDKHPFVAGEFVWNGFDYLGEPTPYYSSRSSYSGIIDLAGFPKDRFYLYQSRWRPDYPMVHILPHWNWPGRIGQVTPVHVFTSGDEVELFLNGKSLGRKKKGALEYRLRWDDVVYEPGELKAIAYKDGKEWAEEIVKTTGEASKLAMKADRGLIDANGTDLAFVTVRVADAEGVTVPIANNKIGFRIEGPGKIVATDNGDSTDMTAFPSHERDAFGGLALVIVKAEKGVAGTIRLTAKAAGLDPVGINITSK